MLPLVAGAAVAGVTEVISALVKKYIPDPEQQAKAEFEVFKAVQSSDLAQIAVNVEQAKSANWFVAGPRPAAMWVGVFGLAYTYLLFPFALAIVGYFNPEQVTKMLNVLPKTDGILVELIFALLGLSGLRTFEKTKGVAR